MTVQARLDGRCPLCGEFTNSLANHLTGCSARDDALDALEERAAEARATTRAKTRELEQRAAAASEGPPGEDVDGRGGADPDPATGGSGRKWPGEPRGGRSR